MQLGLKLWANTAWNLPQSEEHTLIERVFKDVTPRLMPLRTGTCGQAAVGIVWCWHPPMKCLWSAPHRCKGYPCHQSKSCVCLHSAPEYATPSIKHCQPFPPHYLHRISGSRSGIKHCSAGKGVAFRIVPWFWESLNLKSWTKFRQWVK